MQTFISMLTRKYFTDSTKAIKPKLLDKSFSSFDSFNEKIKLNYLRKS